MKWILFVVALLVSLCGSAHAQCVGGNCGVTFRSPFTFWSAPAVRYAPPPTWTTVRVYDPAPVFLPPVEIVEAPIVEYIDAPRIVQRVERRSTRVAARPRLTYSGQSRYEWSGDLRDHMRREHGLSAATLDELRDDQVLALFELECDR